MYIDNQKYDRAVQLMDVKRHGEARKLLLEILADLPEDSDILSFIAVTYLVDENVSKAKEYAIKAVESEPLSSKNHHILSLVYLSTDNLELAAKHNTIALDIDPEDTDVLIALVKIRISQDYFAAANEVIDQILKIEPDHIEALGLRSLVKKHLLGNSAGSEELGYALSLDPTNVFLLRQKAEACIQNGEFVEAQSILNDLVTNDPGAWLLRESLMDSYLGQNFIYRWLVMKFRAFHVGLSYTSLVFDLCLIILGVGLFLKADDGTEFHSVFKYIVSAALIWNLIFWLVRIVGHTWFKLSKWKQGLRDVFDFSFYIHITVGVTQYMGLRCVFTQDFYYFGFAIIVGLLTLASLGGLGIDNPKKKQFYHYYLIYLHVLGVAILIWSYIDSKIADKISVALLGSIFIPLILFSLFDDYKGYRAKKKEPKSLSDDASQNRKRSLSEKLILWSLFPSFMLCQSISLIYGVSILDKVLFAIIWGGLGLLVGYLNLRFLKNNNFDFVDINNPEMKSEEVGGMQLLVIILSVMIVISIGVSITAFVKIGPTKTISAEVIEHGTNEEKNKTQIKIKYNNYIKTIRPDADQRMATKDSKFINMKIRKSLFWIEYVDEVSP